MIRIGFARGKGGCGASRGFKDIEERLKELSAKGNELKQLNMVLDFESSRGDLEWALPVLGATRVDDPNPD